MSKLTKPSEEDDDDDEEEEEDHENNERKTRSFFLNITKEYMFMCQGEKTVTNQGEKIALCGEQHVSILLQLTLTLFK